MSSRFHRPKIIPRGQEDVNKLLDMYYEQRGWDENGLPKPETLERLGLGAMAG
jgi:aldehyde:ferredoxin oxidoreductase